MYKKLKEGVLRSLEGRGELVCKHKTTWPCSILLDQLASGRLRLKISLDDSEATERVGKETINCGPFALEGFTDKGVVFTVGDIHIAERFAPTLGLDWALVGYAKAADLSREGNCETQDVNSLLYELTNFGRSEGMLTLHLGSAQVELGHWPSRERHHDNIARALGTAIVSGTIRILKPEQDGEKNEQLIGSLSELLSLRERAPVYWATKCVCDAKGSWIRAELREPPFRARGWGRPLVPFDSLEEFLQTAYQSYDAKRSSWRLYLALTYHRQAVVTSDPLQIAISVSTAFEALNSAYSSQSEDTSTQTSLTWISPDVFRGTRKRKVVRRIYSLLEKEFPDELETWNSKRRKLFKDHLHETLNRRRGSPFREQLEGLFAELDKRIGLVYTDAEIDLVKKVRNQAFHTGKVDRWEDVKGALNVLERTILAVLGYAGEICPIP